jgi:hypothetical protein
MFEITYAEEALRNLAELKKDPSQSNRHKAVSKALRYLAENPSHPSLQTSPFYSQTGRSGQKLFHSYAQNNTPSAYRIFWFYGPKRREITVTAILPHP